MGPKRDVLGELKKCMEARGMAAGASSHRIEHCFFMGHGKDFESDIKEPMERGDFYWPAMPERPHYDLFSEPAPTEEFLDDWLVRTCELIDYYRPRILYFDWWIQHSAVKPYLKKAAAYYYNRAAEWGVEVAINYKQDAFLFGTAVPDVERGQFADRKPYFWQTDTAMALNSWCYTKKNEYRTAEEILCDLVDIVSKNGALLLNVGPKADGTIAPEEVSILKEIGAWLKVNGEAVYGAGMWREYGEGPTKIVEGQFSDGVKKNFTPDDFRFTMANGYLYATVLKCRESGEYCIRTLGERDASKQANFHGIIKNVEVLGGRTKADWKRDEEGLHIHTEEYRKMPMVFRIRVD